jgi:dihydrodipicolinate synthase/N-acetylneuraminate lyase
MRTTRARVVTLTTFNADLSLNEDGYRRHLRRLAVAGLTVFVAGEGCSEVLSLRRDELRRVLEISAEELNGVVPVIAFGSLGRTAAEQVEFMTLAGAAGHTTVGLYPLDSTHKRVPSEAELEAYYDDVLSSTELDVVVACYSPHDAYVVSPDLLARVIERHANVVEVQCSSPDLVYLTRVMRAAGPSVGVHSGGIEHALTNAALGGTGFVCAEANVTPHIARALADACNEGQFDAAGRHLKGLIELKRLHRHYGFIASMKAMLDGWQMDGGPVRPPMLAPAPAAIEAMRAELEGLDLYSSEEETLRSRR